MTDSSNAVYREPLEDSLDPLRLAVEGSADGFWCLDLADQRLNWLSDRSWALLRRAPEAQGPTLETALQWVHPEDRPQVDRALRAQFEAGTPLDVTFRMQLGDGAMVWMQIRAELCGGPQRRILAGSARDVSAEHEAALRLDAAVAESRLLLREINHRVKNNLQLIISMLMIQARAFEDERVREAFAALANRIKALGMLNDHLSSETGLAAIVLEPYLRQLVAQ